MRTPFLILMISFLFSTYFAHAQYTKLHSFAGNPQGKYPWASLYNDGSHLYGMTGEGGTDNNGTIFKLKKDGTGFQTILNFKSADNGSTPYGSLISDGTFLYGLTYSGGTFNFGTIFKILPDGTGYVKLYEFKGTDGKYLYGSLVTDGSFLYGMTFTGGTSDLGTIFKIKTDGSSFSTLLNFAGSSNGQNPVGDLLLIGSTLYGTTSLGGTNNLGTIFRINTDGSGYSKTHDFVLATGSTPYGALVTDGSFLYGLTYNGGTNNLGTMYRIAPDGASYTKLLDFNGTGNGANPYGALKLVGSSFYGMTAKGGTNSMGTLFKIRPDGSSYTKLLDFNGQSGNGSFPWGNLIAEGDVLYGVTSDEENDNGVDEGTDYGTVFRYSSTITITQQPVNPNNRCEGQNFTFSTDAIGTTNITFQWQKFNTTTSLFENLSDDATYSGTNTKNLLITNVQLAQAGDYRCMIQGDLATTVYCNTGTLTVNTVPAAPLVSNGSRCGNGQVLVSASGTSDGNYIWYGSNGMSEPIPGENNSTYLTPALTATTTYYVSIVNSSCESALVPVDAVITPAPAAPTVTNVTNDGCGTQSFTLKATSTTAGTFNWYETAVSTFAFQSNTTGEFTTDDLSVTTTYYVSFSDGTCESTRVPQTATITNPGPGSIDTSFAPDANSDGNFSAIDDMAIQPDGKIVVNYFETAGVEYLMCRLLPDGTLDPSFTQRSRTLFTGRPDVVTLQSDGKILSGGRFTVISGTSYGRIIRLNTDGTVDGTFTTGSGFNNAVGVITVQSDNKIIIGGSFTSYAGVGANRIIRINENGTRDTGFIIGTGFNAEAKAIVVRSDGKILVGGSFTTYNGSTIPGLVLLNTNGTLDNTFVATGLTNVQEITLQTDGKILVYSNEGLLRLNSDGSTDATFNTGTGFSAAVNTIYCEPSGKILVGGDFQSVDGVTRYFVARLNPNGSLDRYFNTGIGSFTWVYEILPAGTNQIYVVGYFDKWNNVAQNGIAKINSACIRTPIAFDNSSCGPSITLSACGGFNGDYRWYTSATGGTPIAGETNGSITINNLTATTTYYVTLNDGVCESTRVPVIATSLTPAAPTVTGTSGCSSGAFTLTASGGTDGQYRWYTVASGGTPIAGEINSTYTTGTIAATTTYYVSINDGTCESARTAVTASITSSIAPPTATGGAACGPSASITLTASGGSNGQYKWYTVATGGTPIVGEQNDTYTTGTITTTATYYVSITTGTCESSRTAVTATINTLPTAPTATGSAACGPSAAITLTASGGTNGEYRWYTDASGGTAITGQVNNTYTTPALTTTTTYYVAINNGTCESTRTSVVATINSLPTKPTITLSGSSNICSGQSVTLSAPAGFTYQWSNGATTQQITVSTAGSFTVQVNNGTCLSLSSDPVAITITTCNQPPAISTTTATTVIEGSVTINLSALLSDPDNNLDLSSLKIVIPPISGAIATIIGQNLVINYAGVNFGGTDKLTIEVCDVAGVCVQQELSIEVGGDIIAFNGISNNGDDKNAIFLLKYIESLPDTKENKVSIYNRWGDTVWEGVNYDNTNVVFTGQNKNGNDLPTGTYFYKIEFSSGKSTITGYLSLKR